VAHLISNLGEFTSIHGIAKGTTKAAISLPYVAATAITSVISLDVTATEVAINVGQDRSSLSAKVTLEYTKTS